MKDLQVMGLTVALPDASEPLFLLKDVAVQIGLNLSNANRLVKTSLRGKDYRLISGSRKGRPAYYLTENGLYDLLLTVKSDRALEFRYLVVDEILPQIRRGGLYVSPSITVEQAKAGIERLQRIQDLPDPWSLLVSQSTIDLIHKFYGKMCGETFWWSHIYSWMTAEERAKLNTKNPIDRKTNQRKTRIHQWIAEDENVKTRLRSRVFQVVVILETSVSKHDFEDRVSRLDGCDQLSIF